MKYRLIASAFVFLMSVPMAMASDLDDAVDFFNTISKKCTSKFDYSDNDLIIEKFIHEIQNGRISGEGEYLSKPFGSSEFLYKNKYFAALRDLSSDGEVELLKRKKFDLYTVRILCSGGLECTQEERGNK